MMDKNIYFRILYFIVFVKENYFKLKKILISNNNKIQNMNLLNKKEYYIIFIHLIFLRYNPICLMSCIK